MRTIQSEIKRHDLHQKKKVKTIYLKPNKGKEQLSKREIEDLMGVRRDTYTRRNGAIRRK
ncbi:hypothetical protein AAGS61_08765 [Lysinibacillus sp. KU-BSD001]|uniref:hypothetical protein n=1 Tax=Lysinibacillus sp. KU-BSD001 TaxID=3141328 RepID=UPI0036EF35F1